ncbi:MAG: hypothetical protein SPF51_07480 [Candidatus Fimivicinus sp.]|nr:hypothetical protein [Oscillospiraceae bacterium]MDY5591369.1 hypothetical protein [Candidatus Fimivicinus sp.]
MIAFLIALTTEEDIGTRSGRAGPSFSARPEKEAKGAVLHGTSAAAKIPSRATQIIAAGVASAFRKLLNAQSAAGNARFLQPFVT